MDWELPPGYRGLIFDCDGTLVDSMPLHYQAWTAVLAGHNLVFSEARFYEWAGQPVEQIVRRLAEEQGVAVDPRLVAAQRDEYFHMHSASELRPVRKVVDIAQRYRRRIPLAVGTGSTAESAAASLRAIGIYEWFDAIVSSRDGGRPKPAPDVFLLAAERIKVPAGECVVFEDSDMGLEAARAAGMKGVDVRPWVQVFSGR